VEPADASDVAFNIASEIESLIEDYNSENDTELTSDDLNIDWLDFESEIEDWLVDNQEDDTDEEILAHRWLDDEGRDLIREAIRDAAPDIPEADDHNHGDDE
jgi:hypothetical protein